MLTTERRSVGAPSGRWSKMPYLAALDGVRAVSVVAVLLFHAGISWMGGGFLGVEVFFVISGYLITALLVAEHGRSGSLDLRKFWFGRARRLLPALYLMLFVVSAYTVLFLPDVLEQLKGQLVAASFYVTNWYLIAQKISYFQQFGRPSPLTHLWSLAVEEQFYLVWPLVLALLLRKFKDRRDQLALTIFCGALASTLLMALLYRSGADPSRVYYGTDTRAGGLLVGATLAVLWRPWESRRRPNVRRGLLADLGGFGALGLILVFCMVVSETGPFLYRGGFLLVSLTTAVLIACCASNSNVWLRRGLGSKPFVWVGQRSYGIYLWHWPIFAITRPGIDVPLRGLPDLALRFALTGVAAAASYRYVEMPIRRGAIGRWWKAWKASEGDRRQQLNARLLGIGTVSVLLIGSVGYGVATRAPQKSELEKSLEAAGNDPATHAAGVLGANGTTTTSHPVLSATTTAIQAGTTTPATPATTAPPATTTVVPFNAHAPFAIGDSVMLGAYKALQSAVPGIRVDAKVGRQWTTGEQILAALKANGQLGDTVVIHLGNNGTLSARSFDSMMQMLAPIPHVIVLDVRVDQAYQSINNNVIMTEAPKFPNVHVLDWLGYSNGHGAWFYDDGTHLRPTGAAAYAALIKANL
jgi:peptidoglycan/LPS O-acetylase OafA/YrhL